MARPNFLKTPKTIALFAGGILGLTGLAFWGIPRLPQPLQLPASKVLTAQIRMITPGPYRIGDPIRLAVEVRALKGVDFRLPGIPKAAFGKLELNSQTGPEPQRYYGGTGQIVRYTVTGWQTGKWTLPPLKVPYWTLAGKKAEFTIPSRTIAIVSVLPKNRSQAELLALKLKPAKDPVALPPNYQPLWLALALTAAIAAGLGAGLLWRKYRPVKTLAANPTPVVLEPAHQIAFRRLEALRQQDYLTQGLFKEYYTELSECLREYIENRFEINALEMTTEEFLAWLAGHPVLAAEGRRLLHQFLQTSDLVKFARHLPDQATASESWQQIYRLVEQTRPETAPPAAMPDAMATA